MTSRRGSVITVFIALCAVLGLFAGTSEAIGGLGGVGPANVGDSANKICTDPKRVYTLACDLKEKDKEGKETGKLGGLGCPCEKVLTSETIVGKCVAYDVCRAQTISGAPTGSGSDIKPPATNEPQPDTSELSPRGYVTPVVETRYTPPAEVGGSVYTPTNQSGAWSAGGYDTPPAAVTGYSGPVASPISDIGAIAQPSTITDFSTPYLNQGNWMQPDIGGLTRFGSPFQLYQNPENYPAYNTAYRNTAEGAYGSSSHVTFYADVKEYSYYSPAGPSDDFFSILYGAGNAVLSGITNIYTSLGGISDATSADFGTNSPLENALNERIGGDGDEVYPESAAERLVNAESARAAAEDVRESLRSLNQTINRAASSSASTTGATTASPVISSAAKDALVKAEARADALEKELVLGREKLGATNARVKQLTDELNALNDRIRTVDRALSDPNVSEAERSNLIGALLGNIQLALSDAETRLARALVDDPPPSVGQRVFVSLQSTASSMLDWTVSISRGISNFIQSIWKSIFPAF